MSNTYTIEISAIHSYPEYESQNNVVYLVAWTLTATNGINTESISTSTEIPFVSNDQFIEFSNLTSDHVLTWLDEYTLTEHINSHKALLDDFLADRQNLSTPTTQVLPLPYVNTPVTATPSLISRIFSALNPFK